MFQAIQCVSFYIKFDKFNFLKVAPFTDLLEVKGADRALNILYIYTYKSHFNSICVARAMGCLNDTLRGARSAFNRMLYKPFKPLAQ
jgi:hypothetical protein